MSESSNGVFLVAILHHHGKSYETTAGRIEAGDRQDALNRARPWILRKMEECGCKKLGCDCRVSVRSAESSLNSTVLTTYNEEIVG